MNLLAIAAIVSALADPLSGALLCSPDDSDDQFILYPSQLVHQSDTHRVYALMDGVTLAVVRMETLRFNRISNLNLAPRPDRLQLFSGLCRRSPVAE